MTDRSPERERFLSNENKSNVLAQSKLRRVTLKDSLFQTGPGSATVANLKIRTAWLANVVNYEYPIILKQAFLFVMAENDLQIALENDFPSELVANLRESIIKIQSVNYYDSLLTATLEQRVKFLDQFYIHTKAYHLQTGGSGNESDFTRLSISSKGILYHQGEMLSSQKFELKLVSVVVQSKPIYPRLHKKLFLGTLTWNPPPGCAEHGYRLLFHFENHSEEDTTNAIYFKSTDEMQKIKNLFVINSKKALFANNFVKFLAVR